MGEKRRQPDKGNFFKKKYKVSTGIVDPSSSGIYATCNRRQEKKCANELKMLFEDKLQEYYKEELAKEAEDGEEEEEEQEELSIEESIKKELEGLQKQPKDPNPSSSIKKGKIQSIDLGCECVVFIKTRKPIDPETFVERICKEAFESKVKNTRFTQKLTPITFSCSATEEELKKLAERVLKPHFHKEEGQEPLKFAIKVSARSFSGMEKSEIIQKVAACVGNDHGHKVDLKRFDRLVLVECFKNNIGMSVVSNYEKYQRFNLQQIFEKQTDKHEGVSRVKMSDDKNAKNNQEDEKQETKEENEEEEEKEKTTAKTD